MTELTKTEFEALKKIVYYVEDLKRLGWIDNPEIETALAAAKSAITTLTN